VNKAGMPQSNKSELVLKISWKISLVLFILLATIAYKLNDYFKNEKLYSAETQVRSQVLVVKTAVSSQLSQLKNALSGYDSGLDESSINWVQLDPFFAIASLEGAQQATKVNQILVRSNTPAERWNAAYLEKALALNSSKNISPILAQLFQDKTGAKFLILRFKIASNKELAVIGSADYFQKFFDIERGEKGTALLVTTEDLLVAHTEGDYIATQTSETRLSKKKYLYEKVEIVGTNLIAMNYILKNKIAASFAMPWSIVGVIVGFGCILMAILFYTLDPMERKVERYKRQERAQIYKDTLGKLTDKAAVLSISNSVLPLNFESIRSKEELLSVSIAEPELPVDVSKKQNLPKDFYIKNHVEKEIEMLEIIKEEPVLNSEDQFLTLESAKIDLLDIEKALALDDFDSEDTKITAVSSELLKDNLTSQKISISVSGSFIDKPQFVLEKKTYLVDEFRTHIRRPEHTPIPGPKSNLVTYKL